VLKLQSEVARAVAAEIRIQITPEERARLAAARSIAPQAHEAYLLGRYHLSKNLELDPGSLNAHLAYGHLLMCLGRHEEAVREGQIAEQMDPLSSETQTALGRFLYRARRYKEALPHLQRAVAMEPRSIGANFRLADIYVQLGQYTEALAVFENGRKLTRDDSSFQGGSARVYALVGRGREARQMVSGLKGDPVLTC
jgi:tetratricopeptide (TPR) repeat protein